MALKLNDLHPTSRKVGSWDIKPAKFYTIYSFIVSILFAGCSGPLAENDLNQIDEDLVCSADNGGITLPEGFCASLVVESIGPARHLAVASNGDVYIKSRSDEGGIAALRDTTGDYKADIIERFSNMTKVGSDSQWSTGIVIYNGYLWASNTESIYRWPMPVDGVLVPNGDPEIIVSGFPDQVSHVSKSFTFDGRGYLYVNVGAPSNTCQKDPGTPGSVGYDPCPQLEHQAGIWRFDDHSIGQTQQDGIHYATGIRNVVGLDWNPMNNSLYVAQHGRDHLNTLWPDIYTQEDNAELPSEEIFRLSEGANAGWPYCYFDGQQKKKVLAPEYGGDGMKVERCAEFLDPVTAFPGHWAPNDLKIYTGEQFPERYQGGAFVAFHGSWNRAPLPQAGFNVSFIPFENGELSGDYEIFADGFMGSESVSRPIDADYRPMGLAVAPDGALYISDSLKGRIWRVVYAGKNEN